MGVKFNHIEVIESVVELFSHGESSYAAIEITLNRYDDTVRLQDMDDDSVIYLHIDQAQKLKEILNDVLN